MKKAISLIVVGTVLSSACLVGCGDSGPAASPDQMAASRDKQFAGMAKQHSAGANQSATDASKAQGKTTAGG